MPENPTRAKHTVLVLTLAALLRLCVAQHALTQFHANWFFERGTEMGYLAHALLHGQGLSSPFGRCTGPSAMLAPGYPLLVSAVFHCLGEYSLASAWALIGLNIVLNTLSTWFILILARRFATERAAVCAGLFWACSPPLLWMPTIFWETNISSFVLLASVVASTRTSGRLSPLLTAPWVALGAYFNPALLPSLFTMEVALAVSHPRKLRRLSVFTLLFALCYCPWPIRNALVFHAWIPTRTTMGLELWMGNHPGSDGYLNQQLFPTYNPRELTAYRKLGEVQYMANKQQLALQYVRTQPFALVRLTCARFSWFWLGSGTRSGSLWYVTHALVTTLLSLAGLALVYQLQRRSFAMLLTIPVLLFPLPYYLTHAEFRYRLVLDPLLTALGACALEYLFRCSARSWQRKSDP